jgi:hypothetical protein
VGRTSATRDRDLARSSAGEQALAWGHRDALVLAAATLVATADHDPDRAACAEAGCRLPDSDLCALAHRLARLPGAPPVVPTTPTAPAVDAFTSALAASADAVRHCRQTVHAGRDCWFSAGTEADGCGEVLRLLHRLG